MDCSVPTTCRGHRESCHTGAPPPPRGIPNETSVDLTGFFRAGQATGLSVPLEQTVAAIEFERQPPREMFERDFLEQFIGEYELMGLAVAVGLRAGNTLTVTVPGQPVYDLEPFMGTEFKLKGAEGASIRFIIDKGSVTEALFIQPNGVFAAKRKPAPEK